MSQINATGQKEFEGTWEIATCEGDVCFLCGKEILEGEIIYCCEVCGKVTHKSCTYPNKFFCNHNIDFQFYCGRAIYKKKGGGEKSIATHSVEYVLNVVN